MGLYFGFLLRLLITQGYFGHCWAWLTQSQELFCFSHQRVGWGCTRRWEGTQVSQDSWPPLTKGISCTIWWVPCSAGGRGDAWSDKCLSCQVTKTHELFKRSVMWHSGTWFIEEDSSGWVNAWTQPQRSFPTLMILWWSPASLGKAKCLPPRR